MKDQKGSDKDIELVQKLNNKITKVKSEIRKIIVGQEDIVDQLLISLFSRGHCLFSYRKRYKRLASRISGFKDGVKRGSVFDLIKIITSPSPSLPDNSWREVLSHTTEKLSKAEYLDEFWRKLQEGEKLYEHSVGKLIVVEARPDTSTAVVLTSSRELSNGVFVKGVSWVEAPDYLALLPPCPLE